MWFKNVRAYRLNSPFALSPEQVHEQLQKQQFSPCAKSQPLSIGWTAPLGGETETLAHGADGKILLCMKREEKILPATVVREQLQEKVEHIEAEQARKVYRKERLTLKDEIIQDCLPRAFSRSSLVYAFIDTRSNWMFVDSASAGRAEELLNLLREGIGSFPVTLPQVAHSPAATMTSWLELRSIPDDIELTGECELRDPAEDGGVVRCKGIELPSEEADVHLAAGRKVVKLSLRWQERLTLVLAEDLCLRRIRFADELLLENDDIPEGDKAARLDADFVLMSEAIVELQDRVIALFGGEARD